MDNSSYVYKFIPRSQCMGKNVSVGMEEYFEIGDIYFNKYFIHKSILKDKEGIRELEKVFQHFCSYPHFIVRIGYNDDNNNLGVLYLDKKVYTYNKQGSIAVKRKKVLDDFNHRLLI